MNSEMLRSCRQNPCSWALVENFLQKKLTENGKLDRCELTMLFESSEQGSPPSKTLKCAFGSKNS